MIPSQRDAAILATLHQRGVVTISEICDLCHCSPVTARRDLERLGQRGYVARTHGGAVPAAATRQPVSFANGHAPGGHGDYAVQETRTALLDRCDVLIATPTETAAVAVLLQRARRAGIPIIAESTAYDGAATAISIDDYRAGVELGRWVGRNAPGLVGAEVKVLDVSSQLANCEARSRGFADGLRDHYPWRACPAARGR